MVDDWFYVGKNKYVCILIMLETEVAQVIDFLSWKITSPCLVKYQCRWWLGSARNCDISSHSIDVVILQYLGFSSTRVTCYISIVTVSFFKIPCSLKTLKLSKAFNCPLLLICNTNGMNHHCDRTQDSGNVYSTKIDTDTISGLQKHNNIQ